MKYVKFMVVNGIGYRYTGDDGGTSEWVFSGQITLDSDNAVGLSASILTVAVSLSIALLY